MALLRRALELVRKGSSENAESECDNDLQLFKTAMFFLGVT